MARLGTLKPKLALAPTRLKGVTTREVRMTGRKLQDRRLRIWTAGPHCAACGRFTLFPHGFELDHTVRLADGGADTDDNCQVLCVERDSRGVKTGCHAVKTAGEA